MSEYAEYNSLKGLSTMDNLVEKSKCKTCKTPKCFNTYDNIQGVSLSKHLSFAALPLKETDTKPLPGFGCQSYMLSCPGARVDKNNDPYNITVKTECDVSNIRDSVPDLGSGKSYSKKSVESPRGMHKSRANSSNLGDFYKSKKSSQKKKVVSPKLAPKKKVEPRKKTAPKQSLSPVSPKLTSKVSLSLAPKLSSKVSVSSKPSLSIAPKKKTKEVPKKSLSPVVSSRLTSSMTLSPISPRLSPTMSLSPTSSRLSSPTISLSPVKSSNISRQKNKESFKRLEKSKNSIQSLLDSIFS